MSKVFTAPAGYEAPRFNFGKGTLNEYREQEEAYLKRLADWCKKRNPADPDYVGQVLKFPAADGYALYMVAALKPVQLIHIDLMDGYGFQYADRLTKKDIMEKVDQQKGMEEMLNRHRVNPK